MTESINKNWRAFFKNFSLAVVATTVMLMSVFFCSTAIGNNSSVDPKNNNDKNSRVLNIYAWTNYVPREVIKQFSKETGIKVNLSEYDSNETMFAKLLAVKDPGYDIIIPSSYFVDRMIAKKMLTKLDKKNISSGIKEINKTLMNKAFDPDNHYSVPYLWGATGIVVNKKFIDPKNICCWKDLWRKEYKNKLMMLGDIRELFGIAMIATGYDINDKNPKHIELAYKKLLELLPNIKMFNSDAEQTIYIDEDAVIGVGWNGDINMSMEENENIEFIYPQEGFMIWIDSLTIPAGAYHVENAYKFINFTLRPEIAKIISLSTGYTSSNTVAIKMLPEKMQKNEIINPSDETMRRAMLQYNLGKVIHLYEKYWEMLKTAQF